MKISYVSPFSERAAVGFRAKELHSVINFYRMVFYESDSYGISDISGYESSIKLIPGYRRQWLFIIYALHIVSYTARSDVVIFLKAYPANLLAAIILKCLGKRIYFDFDEMDSLTQLDVKSGFSALLSSLFWNFCEKMSKYFCKAHFVSNKRIALKLKLKNFFYLPNFVNFKSFTQGEFDSSTDRNVIYAGSFHNSTEIIECLKWVDPKRYRVILIGSGLELSYVLDFLMCKCYNYYCIGHLDNSALISLLNEIRGVFIAPYRKTKRVEFSSSGKLPIYMSTGCPIIVSSVEGPLDYECQADLFFKFHYPCEIADCLSLIFDNGAFDNNRREKQLSVVRSNFDLAEIAPRLLSFMSKS